MTMFDEVGEIGYPIEKFALIEVFDPSVLASMRVDTSREVSWISNLLAVRLTGFVASWKEEQFLKVPASWWEHIKQRWFPAWALRRWPVRFTTYDAVAILPRVPIVNKEHGEHAFFIWRERP